MVCLKNSQLCTFPANVNYLALCKSCLLTAKPLALPLHVSCLGLMISKLKLQLFIYGVSVFVTAKTGDTDSTTFHVAVVVLPIIVIVSVLLVSSILIMVFIKRKGSHTFRRPKPIPRSSPDGEDKVNRESMNEPDGLIQDPESNSTPADV